MNVALINRLPEALEKLNAAFIEIVTTDVSGKKVRIMIISQVANSYKKMFFIVNGRPLTL